MSMSSHKAHRHRRCGLGILARIASLAALALVTASGAVQAQDRILGLRIISESVDQLVLEVSYEYTGARGNNVFVTATMANRGEASRYYAVRPARVGVGRGRARITLGTAQSAPDAFTSDALLIGMYVGGQKEFLRRSFDYLKTWSRAGVELEPTVAAADLLSPPVVVVQQAPPVPAGGVTRRIGPDGVVELHFPDGSVKRVYQGGMDIQDPDGSVSTMRYMEAQPPTPPSAPPDARHAAWLDGENERLLDIIRQLVGNDEASLANYLGKEGDGLSPYQRISRRTITIDFLLTP